MGAAIDNSAETASPVMQEMSFLDRWLAVWIILAMGLGLALGRFVPGLNAVLDSMTVGGISIPIAVGLLVMMYPVLAKVRYNETHRVTGDRKLLILSLVLNWVLGPLFMFVLAWVFLADLPEYRTGLIIVGLARCIAMVFIWNDMACGDREAAAVLVAINSVFQVVAYGALGWFYLQALPSWLGLATTSAQFSVWAIVASVLVFLGIPLLAGFLTRTFGEKTKGRGLVRKRFPTQNRALVALRSALHHRAALCFPRRRNSLSTVGCGPDGRATPVVFRADVPSQFLRLENARSQLRQIHFGGVHGVGQ